LGGPPVGLWTRGHADLANRVANCVAIVGSRAATSYGQDVASELAFDLARRSDIPDHTSWTIISGGAFGVDVAAHRGALAARGCTVSVQAGGLDQLYPRGNTAVLEQVACGGALVSEVPPGAHPTKPGFLARNRLIAAMSSGVVIVEAGIRSGALNTTMWANALMRPVMAIPGPVTSSMSAGTHRLIRDNQAVLVRDADDVSA
ncbi:DNA-processing protein DprA, partial [Cutibacterium acnes]